MRELVSLTQKHLTCSRLTHVCLAHAAELRGSRGQLDAQPWRIELQPVSRSYTRRPYFRSGAEAGELLRPTPDIGMGSVFRVHPCVYCQACFVSQIGPRWYGSV